MEKLLQTLVLINVIANCIHPIQGNFESALDEWCSALRKELVRWDPTPPPGAQRGFRTPDLYF